MNFKLSISPWNKSHSDTEVANYMLAKNIGFVFSKGCFQFPQHLGTTSRFLCIKTIDSNIKEFGLRYNSYLE